MHIPLDLNLEINKQLENISLNKLRKYFLTLSADYKQGEEKGIKTLSSDMHRLAYLAARMPATYVTLVQTLREARLRLPSLRVESSLDIGAGPGTGLWAIQECFPEVKQVTLLEKDPGFIHLGKQLAWEKWGKEKEIRWEQCDATHLSSFPRHDVVMASFSLGEMEEMDRQNILFRMWDATKKILVIIEPGTPKGFGRIQRMRKTLLSQGAHLIAPCPHAEDCPIRGNDWCHFGARVARTALQRHVKEAMRNYEDEKYCYLLFSREKGPSFEARILARPQKNKGHITLKLCSEKGIDTVTVSRKAQARYSIARKSEWGDIF